VSELARHGARARPVADAPVDALVASADGVARDWLLALLSETPLTAAASVPVAELAAEGPALCAAMARALASDAALDRLGGGGDLFAAASRAGALAGATDPASAAAAVDVLRAVLWTAALAELHRPDPTLIADLAGRLATVAAVVTGAALGAGAGAEGVDVSDAGAAAGPDDRAAPHTDPAPAPPQWSAAGHASTPASPVVWTPTQPPVGLPPLQAAPPPQTPTPTPPAEPPPARPTPLHRADQLGEGSDPSPFPARDPRPRIMAGDPLAHVAERVSHHLVDHRTLTVLLVELDGVDRLMTAGDEAMEAVARAEIAIEGLLRPGDGARRESAGRIWVTLPGTGAAGARALALRISVAVERAASHRGMPLTAAIGIAVFPSDATDAHGLADHAEEALYAARAAGHRGPQPA
jgi:GGDEF domain-containing protein